MFEGPAVRLLDKGRDGLVELITLRVFWLFVLIRHRHDLNGIGYGQMCKGLSGLAVLVKPALFDRIVSFFGRRP